MSERSGRPRAARLSSRPLPETTFISGRGQPHPSTTDSAEAELPLPLEPQRPEASEALGYAIDLFHHGYYWEAHETWEALWNAAGRQGEVAELLKGLIKLAAAGVKVRQGMPDGVRSHTARAQGHFEGLLQRGAGDMDGRFCGFDLAALCGFAETAGELADDGEALKAEPGSVDVVPVFGQHLPFEP